MDTIHILGQTTDLFQKFVSMEIEHKIISSANPGNEGADNVVEPVKKGDAIYLINRKTG